MFIFMYEGLNPRADCTITHNIIVPQCDKISHRHILNYKIRISVIMCSKYKSKVVLPHSVRYAAVTLKRPVLTI